MGHIPFPVEEHVGDNDKNESTVQRKRFHGNKSSFEDLKEKNTSSGLVDKENVYGDKNKCSSHFLNCSYAEIVKNKNNKA